MRVDVGGITQREYKYVEYYCTPSTLAQELERM